LTKHVTANSRRSRLQHPRPSLEFGHLKLQLTIIDRHFGFSTT
jgi:hypothetical protein